jgi:hypothetical protein
VSRPARMRLICHDFCDNRGTHNSKKVHACHIFLDNRYFGNWRDHFATSKETMSRRRTHTFTMLHHGCVLFVLLVGISSSVGSMGGSDQAMMAESASGDHNRRRSYLRPRALQQAFEFDVDLFLELQFVGELTASALETKDPGNSAVVHFCEAVQIQVRIMTIHVCSMISCVIHAEKSLTHLCWYFLLNNGHSGNRTDRTKGCKGSECYNLGW